MALLALVAAGGKGGVSRERIIGILWGESEEERARHILSQNLYSLRRETGRNWIVATPELHLEPGITSDVGEFHSAVAASDFPRAAALYAGEFLAGFYLPGSPEFERWVEEERARLKGAALRALESLAARDAEAGRHQESIGSWRRLAELDPLSGRYAAGLMRALAAAGDHAAALAHAKDHGETVKRELDAELDPAVRALAASIRGSVSGPGGHPPAAGAPAATMPEIRPASDQVPELPDQAVGEPLAKAVGFATGGELAQAAMDSRSAGATVRRRIDPWFLSLGVGAVVLAAGVTAVVLARRAGSRLPPLVLGNASQVTAEAGLEIQPAISPDGKLIAYAAGSSQRMRIFIRPIAGGRTIPLLDDPGAMQTNPRWSPDGSKILFVARDGALIAPTLGGVARRVIPSRVEAPVTSADWSPDGRQIAFVRADSLFVRAAEEGPARLIHLNHGNWLHSCAWRPTGKVIACVSGNYDFTRVGRRFGNLAPSQVLLIPVAGGEPVAVTDPVTLNQSPEWSADGRWLYFISNHQGPRDVYALPVSAGGRPGVQPVRLTTGLGPQSIDLTPDGTRLVYSSYTARGNIWSLPIPVGGPISIAAAEPVTSGTQVVEAVRVSADRRWLLYDSDLHGNADIYRIPLAGGEPERLTTDPADEFAPDLSPDGEALAFHSFATGTRDIVIRRLDGGPAEQVAPSPAQESFPRWSPDGDALLIWDQPPFNRVYIVRRRPDGAWGTPALLVKELEFPSWSLDGRLVLGTTLRTNGVAVIPVEGGGLRMLYEPRPGSSDPPVEWVEWSRDGQAIYFKSLDPAGRASLWVLPMSGGRPRLLVRFDDPTRPSARPDFATDGRRFYFTIEDRQSDIWVAQLSQR